MPLLTGIWQYVESDSASNWSGMLNKLGDSTRTFVTGLSSGLTEALNLVDDLGITQGMAEYFWTDFTERNAQTGMKAGDIGFQADNQISYRYNGSAWRIWEVPKTTYTPSIGGGLTLNNGSTSGWWGATGGRAWIDVTITAGSGTTLTADWNISLPSARDTSIHPNGSPIGDGIMRDVSSGDTFELRCIGVTNNIAVRSRRVSGSNIIAAAMSATIPVAIATGDEFRIQAEYLLST